MNVHEKHEGVSLNAKMTGSYINSALVKPPPDERGEGHLQRRKAAVRNGTSLDGDSYFLFFPDFHQGCKNWNETYPKGWC